MIEAGAHLGAHFALDFPGFGKSPAPARAWGTAEYADHVASWLASLPCDRRVWIGHSFGCRVGMQIAARHPGLLSALVLIAPAGLRPHRTRWRRLVITAKTLAYKTARLAASRSTLAARWRDRAGSRDYRAAGALRPILVKVVTEDLSAVAAAVRCRTIIICGADDRETPPEISTRLAALIPDSRLVVLNNFDHYTILTNGLHQVLGLVSGLVRDLAA